ncbi:hypothetical protein [Actinoplanes aureus]|uniref:Uncharacterized protein n=1 Tax=Actinoplanes aureus TaxID=2792083 RepID=A0A931CLX2_9ACTN|nr:hypothetical protein [Actinoplanes aureus]MBG0568698.1 hypothetical protein [Actinoplanes aureus]
MSSIPLYLRFAIFQKKSIVILIAHLPIILISIGLLPSLLLGVLLAPARYTDAILSYIRQLRTWSCAVVSVINEPQLGPVAPIEVGSSEANQACELSEDRDAA